MSFFFFFLSLFLASYTVGECGKEMEDTGISFSVVHINREIDCD